MISSQWLFLGLHIVTGVLALDNGLARTPPMGWNPYNAFSCNTTEPQYRAAAHNLIDLGLKDLGYEYLNLDCRWQGKTRNATGGFTWDTTILPSGVPALASFVHSLGLKFGVYSDGGVYACDFVYGTAHYLGSLGHEEDDAASFASWGADYLKVIGDLYNPVHASEFTCIIAAMFSYWRMSNDDGPPPSWDNLIRVINQVVSITQFAQPGGWNDLDLLEVGNERLTLAEQQTHFAFWAAAKSPLLISTDLSQVTKEELAILKNRRVIALNIPWARLLLFKRRYTNDHDVWSGPLADGSTVAVIINWQNSSRALTFSLADVGLSPASVTDVITGESLGTAHTSITQTVAAHGSMDLKLARGVPSPPQRFTFYNAAAPSNILAGGANTRVVNGTVTVVGYVGNGGTLTFNNLDDFTYGNTDCSNCRNAFISVNGGPSVQAQMPISAESWDIVLSGYLLSMSGFKPGKTNKVEISNPNAFAPDFVRLGVAM